MNWGTKEKRAKKVFIELEYMDKTGTSLQYSRLYFSRGESWPMGRDDFKLF